MRLTKAIPVFLFLAAIVTLVLPVSASASLFLSKDRYKVAAADTIDDDIYLAASKGLFDGVVTGDVVIATKDYTITGEIHGNVNSLSQGATIRGNIGKTARLFAQTIIIHGQVGNNLLAFGQDIDISEDSRIGRDASLFGEDVSFSGEVGGNMTVECGQVYIAGKIDGDLYIEAEKITVVSPAEITGDIIYKSGKKIRIEEDVIVGGEIQWEETVAKEKSDDGIAWPLRILLFFASLVTGLFIIGFTNRHARLSSDHIIQKPVVSLGLGFVAFCGIPVAIVVLLALIISIPVAIILLFAYTVFFYIAKIYVAIAVGRLGIRAFRRDADPKQGWSLLFGLIILTILFVIPVLGWFVYFAVLFWGMGALLLGMRSCRITDQPGGGAASESIPPIVAQ
jgi:cytoskeletal protein CcmA (bactofilin family)